MVITICPTQNREDTDLFQVSYTTVKTIQHSELQGSKRLEQKDVAKEYKIQALKN